MNYMEVKNTKKIANWFNFSKLSTFVRFYVKYKGMISQHASEICYIQLNIKL